MFQTGLIKIIIHIVQKTILRDLTKVQKKYGKVEDGIFVSAIPVLLIVQEIAHVTVMPLQDFDVRLR